MSLPYIRSLDLDKDIIWNFQDKNVDIHINKKKVKKYGVIYVEIGGNPACVDIIVFKDTEIVSLDGLRNSNQCIEGLSGRGSGTFLLRLAKDISNNLLSAKGIKLQDSSHFYCNDAYLDLSLYSFLTTGDTWYARNGFLPLLPEERQRYLEDREILRRMEVSDLSDKLRVNLHGDSIINAMSLITCDKFEEIGKDLLVELGITPIRLKGETFGETYGDWAFLF